MEKFVQIESVGQTFDTKKGKFVALRDIDLTIKQGEFIAFGGKAVAITAINSSDASKDVLTTAAFGTTVAIGAKGYQAKSAKTSGAEAIYTPAYLTGNKLEGGTVNNFVRLVNGASVRAVTTNIAPEILANLKSINLV